VYDQETVIRNRLFPLWHYTRREYGEEDGPAMSKGAVLWKLYDSKTEQGTVEEPHDYVRRRLLWRVWHYERLDGDVSVDAFPFITYDRKDDGFKRTSFLWRFFRYENHPEEGKKLDLLFIPVRRSAPEPATPEEMESGNGPISRSRPLLGTS